MKTVFPQLSMGILSFLTEATCADIPPPDIYSAEAVKATTNSMLGLGLAVIIMVLAAFVMLRAINKKRRTEK
ncbi:MAG TPA: hypothetical protein PKH77_09875 [Anaerolineae bacterium]|nr:hypothetical protein [Anaerolineae bacterium]